MQNPKQKAQATSRKQTRVKSKNNLAKDSTPTRKAANTSRQKEGFTGGSDINSARMFASDTNNQLIDKVALKKMEQGALNIELSKVSTGTGGLASKTDIINRASIRSKLSQDRKATATSTKMQLGYPEEASLGSSKRENGQNYGQQDEVLSDQQQLNQKDNLIAKQKQVRRQLADPTQKGNAANNEAQNLSKKQLQVGTAKFRSSQDQIENGKINATAFSKPSLKQQRQKSPNRAMSSFDQLGLQTKAANVLIDKSEFPETIRDQYINSLQQAQTKPNSHAPSTVATQKRPDLSSQNWDHQVSAFQQSNSRSHIFDSMPNSNPRVNSNTASLVIQKGDSNNTKNVSSNEKKLEGIKSRNSKQSHLVKDSKAMQELEYRTQEAKDQTTEGTTNIQKSQLTMNGNKNSTLRLNDQLSGNSRIHQKATNAFKLSTPKTNELYLQEPGSSLQSKSQLGLPKQLNREISNSRHDQKQLQFPRYMMDTVTWRTKQNMNQASHPQTHKAKIEAPIDQPKKAKKSAKISHGQYQIFVCGSPPEPQAFSPVSQARNPDFQRHIFERQLEARNWFSPQVARNTVLSPRENNLCIDLTKSGKMSQAQIAYKLDRKQMQAVTPNSRATDKNIKKLQNSQSLANFNPKFNKWDQLVRDDANPQTGLLPSAQTTNFIPQSSFMKYKQNTGRATREPSESSRDQSSMHRMFQSPETSQRQTTDFSSKEQLNQQKLANMHRKHLRKNKNYTNSVKDLFDHGMGVQPTFEHDVGQKVPKLGVVSKNSQKFFNRQRDQVITNGTFKLAYEDDELDQAFKPSLQIVEKNSLPMFVTNEIEKRHIADPDANRLFNIKSKLPKQSEIGFNTESVSRTLFEEARPFEAAKEEPTRKQLKSSKKLNSSRNVITANYALKGHFNQNAASYLDNYRKQTKQKQIDNQVKTSMANLAQNQEEKTPRPAKRQLQTTVVFMQKQQANLITHDANSKSLMSTPKRQGKKKYLNDPKSVEKINQKGKVKYINDSQFQIADMAANTIDGKQEIYEKRSDSLFQRDGALTNYIAQNAKANTTFMKYQRALNQAGVGGKQMLSFGTENQQERLRSRNGSELSKTQSQSNLLDMLPRSKFESARHSQLSLKPSGIQQVQKTAQKALNRNFSSMGLTHEDYDLIQQRQAALDSLKNERSPVHTHQANGAVSSRGLSARGRYGSGLDVLEKSHRPRQESSMTRKLNFLKSNFEIG